MKKLVIANWKTYLTVKDAVMLCENLSKLDNIIISPSMVHIALLAEKFPHLKIASQDVSSFTQDYGAYTGETPTKLLEEMGVKYSIIGHSERRAYKLDNKDTIAKKIAFCLDTGITPIICIGETIEDRENNRYLEVIDSQLMALKLSSVSKVIIAYEPTWSVGTGILPSLEQIKEIMNRIKAAIKFVDNETILVYGGSVSAQNAKTILAIPEVNGLLVGKAATDASHLKSILNIIKEIE